MKKIISLFLIIFISLIYSVNSLKVFEIEETEKLSLGLETDDPDSDKLTYTFTQPLDTNGDWQSTYGDAGEYKASVTLSDGETEVSEDILIIVTKKEEEPTIETFFPKEEYIMIDENQKIKFGASGLDPNMDKLN